jgi:hypothetical protein
MSRSKAAKILFALTLLAAPRALAEPRELSGSIAAIPPALQFCRNLQAGREDLPRVNRRTWLRDLLKLALAPGRLVGLKSLSVETPAGARIPAPPPARHLIFSISPPETVLRTFDLPSLREQLAKESAELRSLSGTALSLLYAPTPEACAREVEQTGFDHVRFLSLLEGRSRFRILDQLTEAAAARAAIRKAIGRSRLRWELIEVSDLQEVHRFLNDPAVEDVILIGHGLSDGKLLDSRNNSYPLRFFERLGPRLRSLAIYSCHSEEVARFYRMEENLRATPTYRANRAIYLSPGSVLGGGEERVPIRGFPRFLRRLEGNLLALEGRERWSPAETPPPTPVETPSCRLRVPGFQVQGGTFGFILNGHYLGAVHEEESDPSFEWPCRFLRSGLNVVEIRNLGTLDLARARDQNFGLKPEGPVIESGTEVRIEHYFRPDASYQGSKGEFFWFPTDPQP